jgi:hypothetical protein
MMFTEPHAAKIIKGEKTATRRVMSDNPRSPWSSHRCLYEVGQTFTVNPGRGVVRVAEAKIEDVYEQPPVLISDQWAQAEGFPFGRDEFLEAFQKINKGIDLHDPVWVVEFKLAGPPCEHCGGRGFTGSAYGAYLRPECIQCFGTGIEPTQRARDFVERVERELAEAAE